MDLWCWCSCPDHGTLTQITSPGLWQGWQWLAPAARAGTRDSDRFMCHNTPGPHVSCLTRDHWHVCSGHVLLRITDLTLPRHTRTISQESLCLWLLLIVARELKDELGTGCLRNQILIIHIIQIFHCSFTSEFCLILDNLFAKIFLFIYIPSLCNNDIMMPPER